MSALTFSHSAISALTSAANFAGDALGTSPAPASPNAVRTDCESRACTTDACSRVTIPAGTRREANSPCQWLVPMPAKPDGRGRRAGIEEDHVELGVDEGLEQSVRPAGGALHVDDLDAGPLPQDHRVDIRVAPDPIGAVPETPPGRARVFEFIRLTIAEPPLGSP
jgi:hypothetical protein